MTETTTQISTAVLDRLRMKTSFEMPLRLSECIRGLAHTRTETLSETLRHLLETHPEIRPLLQTHPEIRR